MPAGGPRLVAPGTDEVFAASDSCPVALVRPRLTAAFPMDNPYCSCEEIPMDNPYCSCEDSPVARLSTFRCGASSSANDRMPTAPDCSGWISMLLWGWLRNVVQPPGSRTHVLPVHRLQQRGPVMDRPEAQLEHGLFELGVPERA